MEDKELENQEQLGKILETKVVFDGECEHNYQEVGLDPEGVMQAECTKCPQGRRYKTDEYECRDGNINRI